MICLARLQLLWYAYHRAVIIMKRREWAMEYWRAFSHLYVCFWMQRTEITLSRA